MPRKDAIAMLKEDHKKVRGLLKELEATSSRGVKIREKLLSQIEMEIKVHSKLEEDIFYPAYKAAAQKSEQRDLFFEATEEHHLVDMVLPELKATDPTSEVFHAKAVVLQELIKHHAGEEEKEMFKEAKSLMTEEELLELAERMEVHKKKLLAQFKNPVTRAFRKVQGSAEKFMGSSVKNAKAGVAPSSARSRGRSR